MKRNLRNKRKTGGFKTRRDIYNNLIVELPNELNENRVSKDADNEIATLNDIFRSFSPKINVSGTRTLSLTGNILRPRLGRCFNDTDVPALLNFLRENSDIVELNLTGNEIHCPGFVSIIDYIIIENRIKDLSLENNEIGSIGITHLCKIGEKLNLQILRLSGNKFGVECSKKLALLLLENRKLRHLDVAEVDQTMSSFVYFTTVLRSDQNRYNDSLKVLDVSSPNPGCMYRLDTAHIASLVGSMLRNNNCLEELHLRKFGFSCHDIELLLAEGRYNDTLLSLNISCNNIGDFGIELIAKWLAGRPALSGLAFAHNIVTCTGAIALSYGLPFSKLKYLDVSYNRISDYGIVCILNSLKKSPYVRQLRIFGNAIGRETAKIVSRMLLSGVLVQERFDVKPYVVDDEYYCARYPTAPWNSKALS